MINELLAAAASAFRSGQLDRAEGLLQKVVAEEPQNLEARIGLGMIAANAGRSAQAIERMREVLNLDPDSRPALHWLTLLCSATGQIEECANCANRFLKLYPENAQVVDALGRCYLATSKPLEALECFERSCSLEPNVALLHLGRSAALRQLSRNEEAISALNRSIELAPGVEPYIRLAEAQMAMGRVDDALASCRQALFLNESDVSAHVALARILTESGQTETADRHWARATALAPTSRRLSIERAESRIFSGRFEAASEDLRAAVQADPRHGAAYRILTQIQKPGDIDREFVSRLQHLAQDSSLPDEDRLEIFYALGKAYENLGDYESAMRSYDKANALKLPSVLAGRQFSQEGFRAYIDRYIEIYTSELYRSTPAPNSSNLPIVVVGLLRSGTTLAEQILSCHPEVGAGGEQPFWVNHEHETIRDNPPSVEIDTLAGLAQEYVALLESVAPGFPHVVDKNPANSLLAGLIHLSLPNVRIIRMRRNLIDTALSTWMTPMQTMAPFVCDRDSIVFAFKEISRLMDHWRDVIPSSYYLEVSYEALVAEPEKHTREMVAFCGLEWDDACLRPEHNKRPVKTPSFWQVRRPIYKTSSEKWRNYEPWLGPFEELRGFD